MNNNFHLRARMLQSGRMVYTALALLVPFAIVVSFNAVPILIERFVFSESMLVIAAKTVAAFLTAAVCIYSYFALSYGMKKYFFERAKSEESSLSFLFCFFKLSNIIKTIRFGFFFSLAKLLILAVCLVPSAAMFFLLVRMINNDASLKVAVIFVFCLLLMLSCSLYFYFKAKRLLFLCEFLFIEDSSRSFFECAKISTEKMEHETGKLFRLRMSFSGWIMLCVMIFPIAYVWGYYQQTMAVAAREILSNSNKDE